MSINYKNNKTDQKIEKEFFLSQLTISCVEIRREIKFVNTGMKIILKKTSRNRSYWILHTVFFNYRKITDYVIYP